MPEGLFALEALRESVEREPVSTVCFSNAEALGAISVLYGHIQYDATYSDGLFWEGVPKYFRPTLRSDILPIADFVADFRELPLASASIESMLLDPPFLHSNPAESPDGSNIIAKRFSTFRTQADLKVAYHGALIEARRVLKKNGVLTFKCQDIVESGKQVWNHCHVWDMATRCGFVMEDLFILVASSRAIGGNHQSQKHARKFHSYFLVFLKKGSE